LKELKDQLLLGYQFLNKAASRDFYTGGHGKNAISSFFVKKILVREYH